MKRWTKVISLLTVAAVVSMMSLTGCQKEKVQEPAGTQEKSGTQEPAGTQDQAGTQDPAKAEVPDKKDKSVLFATGFENGETDSLLEDTIDWKTDTVVGSSKSDSEAPELSLSGEKFKTGTKSIKYSGEDGSEETSHVYFKMYEVNIPVTATTMMSYWINPEQDNGRYVSVDLEFTDLVNSLRDGGAVDANGFSMHPNAGHGGKIPLNEWSQVTSNIGKWNAGRVIQKIWVAYDRPESSGDFSGYIDDIVIYDPAKK